MGLRVLHIGKFFPPHHGGMEVFLADLITAQQAQGLTVEALVHGDPLNDDPPWLTRVPVQVTLVYAPLALGFRAALAKVIQRLQPNVLHVHMPNTSVFWALTLESANSIPWVVHWHSDVVVSKISPSLALAYKLYRPFEQAVLERAERIIATSLPYLEASEPLAQWRDKCAVVPLGLAHPHLTANQGDSSEMLPWTSERFRLLSIGRLTYYKDYETLIRVVAGMTGVELLIVGAGELMPKLKELVNVSTAAGELPNVRLLGEVGNSLKHSLLKSCDAFCLASVERTEAFGVVLLEAMAHAKACIVSELAGSGMPWLIKVAGCGLTVLPRDITGWRAAIERLRQNASERLGMGRSGQATLHAKFSVDVCGHAISDEYALLMPDPIEAKSTGEILIVIPARDEALTIGGLLRSLSVEGWKHVLVVDDQSQDATAEIATTAGAKVLRPVLSLGAWGAMQTGIRYGLSNGYSAVITMDADGQHEVSQLPELSRHAQSADLVIGAFPERASVARKLAWFWFRTLTGLDLRDLTSGFRCYNHKAMQLLASTEATLLDYQDVGTLLMLRNAGLAIKEVPVSMSVRQSGRSRIFSSWLMVAKYMAITTLLCLSRWGHREKSSDCLL